AGSTACILLAAGALSSWTTLIERLIVLLLPLLALGGWLYRPSDQPRSPAIDRKQSRTAPLLLGLTILYLFFVGISGFLAYAAQQASARGMAVSDAILSIGAMKIAAAAWLLGAACLVPNKAGREVGALETVLLILALWIVFLSQGIAGFIVGFFL